MLPASPEECYQALKEAAPAGLAALLSALPGIFHTKRLRGQVRDDLLARAKEFSRRGRAEQARRCVLGALAVDPRCASRAEREVLVPYDLRLGNVGTKALLAALLADEALLEACSAGATDRLRSYQHLLRIEERLRREFYLHLRILEHRPPSLVRALLTLAEVVAFWTVDECLGELLLPGIRADLADTPAAGEMHLEIFSAMLAELNQLRPISAEELSQPAAPYMFTPEFAAIVATATRRHVVRRVRDAISLSNHRLERVDQGPRELYVLRPLDPELARALWSGSHIRDVEQLLRVDDMRRTPDNSLFSFMRERPLEPAEAECVLAPYPRHRFTLPVFGDQWSTFDDAVFIEDHRERRHQEELVLTDLLMDHTVVGELSLRRALVFYRRMTSFGLMHCGKIARLAPHATRDALANSLVRTLSVDELAELLAVDVPDALAIWTWRGRPGRFDLQYTPLVRAGDDVAFAPALACISTGMRNTLIHRQARPLAAGAMFVTLLRELLRTRFQHVASERRIADGDADLAVLDGATLWVFECKFNVYPTGPFEQRGVVADLEEGVVQLQRITASLERDPHLLARMRSWFPDASRAECVVTTIRRGIVSSVRDAGGAMMRGVPVRDFFSLRNFLTHGYFEARGQTAEGQPDVRKISVWRGAEFDSSDFHDFWSASSLYQSIRDEGLRSMTGFMHITPDMTLARESWTRDLGATREQLEDLIHDLQHARERLDAGAP